MYLSGASTSLNKIKKVTRAAPHHPRPRDLTQTGRGEAGRARGGFSWLSWSRGVPRQRSPELPAQGHFGDPPQEPCHVFSLVFQKAPRAKGGIAGHAHQCVAGAPQKAHQSVRGADLRSPSPQPDSIAAPVAGPRWGSLCSPPHAQWSPSSKTPPPPPGISPPRQRSQLSPTHLPLASRVRDLSSPTGSRGGVLYRTRRALRSRDPLSHPHPLPWVCATLTLVSRPSRTLGRDLLALNQKPSRKEATRAVSPWSPGQLSTQEGDLRGKWQPWRWGPRDLSPVLSPSSLSFCRDGRRQRPSSTGERRWR